MDTISERRWQLLLAAGALGALATIVIGWRRRAAGAGAGPGPVSADGGGPEPPPDDLSRDPAYEPPEPLKDIKGG